MKIVYFNIVILMCVLIEIQSESIRSGLCIECHPLERYTRMKRAKYYSSSPQRFYKRPPMTYPIRGAFSYTPPPGYMMDDDEQLPPNFRPKVSKRPTNEGLGDEDLNNIMKYLSKQDLDRIIGFANEKERESPNNSQHSTFENPYYINNKPDIKTYENKITYKEEASEVSNDQRFSLNGPYANTHEDFRAYNIDYNSPNENVFQNSKALSIPAEEPALFINTNKIQYSVLGSQESMLNQKFSYPNLFEHHNVKENFTSNGDVIFTDSTVMQEEQLPKPSNLRENDYDTSFTNNVPTVVKADSESYKIENFGVLPLMNYHSKLDTVDSYKVPHYTVTSQAQYKAPAPSASIKAPPVEPSPPISSAKEQSDAHLKATKIWTHRSKGIAYTLHEDGSLSLERPLPRKTNYGFS